MRWLIVVLVMMSLAACNSQSDNGSIVGPNPNDPGDPAGGPLENVSFSRDVLPIFLNSCGGSGCHVPGNRNGVNLGSWSAATSSVGQLYGRPIIVAGNASQSPLVDKLGSSPSFGIRMPDGRGPLTSREIETIVTWVNEGGLNN
jgi:hypothetical protein